MSYEAILFDMDGVIIDTHQSVTAFWQKVAGNHHVQLTPADFEQHVYGCPATYTLDLLFPGLNAAEREAIMAEMADYEANLTYTAIKGVIAFLRSLKKQDIPTALVTSGDQWKVEAVTNQLDIAGLFSTHITVNHIKRGKPQPECYLLAAQRLQKSPRQCIVFEDAVSGVKAAVASGALCIGVQSWPSMASLLLQAGACCITPDFSSVSLQASSPGQDEAKIALDLCNYQLVILKK